MHKYKTAFHYNLILILIFVTLGIILHEGFFMPAFVFFMILGACKTTPDNHG